MSGTPITIKPGTLNGKNNLYDAKLSLIQPFFGELKRFEIQYENWQELPSNIKDSLEIIIIDDCGNPPIHTLMTRSKLKRCNFNLSIFRITDNLKWNTPGALNLGIMCAPTNWILIMDSDCLFESIEFGKLMNTAPLENWIYKFPRKRITNNSKWAKNDRYLPCTILFHKQIFFNVNGFDEDFTGQWSGGYGFFDNHFDHKVRIAGYHCGQIPWITAIEYMDDFVGPRIYRDHSRDHAINTNLMYEKMRNPEKNSKKMLRFNWELMFSKRRV